MPADSLERAQGVQRQPATVDQGVGRDCPAFRYAVPNGACARQSRAPPVSLICINITVRPRNRVSRTPIPTQKIECGHDIMGFALASMRVSSNLC
jgi:hypothetical protein